MMRGTLGTFVLAAVIILQTGCPVVPVDSYEAGYRAGFLQDDWYWDGFYDGFDTLDDYPLYYQGSRIPEVEEPEYDAGYYDGLWYAYNDGYFVDYDYAFTIGFSEGYDAAFFEDYLDFLYFDEHVEYGNGGWGDGYNDGFSEGRVFGAYDYEQGLPFDWIDALTDYRSGTDLYFGEVDAGTGAYGPVELYVYGTDPAGKALRSVQTAKSASTLRNDITGAKANEDSIFRPLTSEIRKSLDKRPSTSPRSGRTLTLTTTWLQRIEAYEAFQKSGVAAKAHARPAK